MKPRLILAAALALSAAVDTETIRAEELIFDNDAAEFAEGVQFVNGRIVLTGAAEKTPGQEAQPDPAGEQVLELSDGSQLHGRLENLGKSELTWRRGDTPEPLLFSPQDVKRISLAPATPPPRQRANATLKLHGSDWLTGDLIAFEKGRFRLALNGAGTIEIARDRVDWIHLSKANPPDAYEGPIGPMGLSGWDTGAPSGSEAWDYADGALAARAAMPLARQFEFLPERMELEFSASDGGNAIRGLTLWLQPGGQQRGYSKGSIYLRFQGNNISANSYDGNNMKNVSATVPENKKPPKETRYRLLHDRRTGKFIIFVNGAKVADWELQGQKEPAQGGSMSWQPTYWSSNMAWTLSKVRMRPWDGNAEPNPKEEELGKDLLSAGTAGRQAGNLESVSRESIIFSKKAGTRAETYSRLGDAVFIRLAKGPAADPPAGAVARIWLAQRGEFDVTALGIRDGQLTARTSFGGDISLPLTAVRAIAFPHRLSGADKQLAETGDMLVFRNSDELRGTLISVTHDQSVKWKPVKGERPVEFAVNRIAGILFPKRTKPSAGNTTAAVRFRNGDWLNGEMMLLDQDRLHFKSPLADSLQLQRGGIRSIYFGHSGEIPVWDGASERHLWMKGNYADGRFSSSRGQRRDDLEKFNPWRYLDGAFTLPQAFNRGGSSSGPNIGRTFDSLPDKVEVSFELSTPESSAGYAIQLFSEENRPGLMIQGSWDSAYIYDMSPRKQGGAFFNQPQQIEFGEQIGSEGNRRHFRFLAERKTGRLVMIVNGIPVGQFGQRPGKESAKPGKGIAILPQQMSSTVTISNLWIGPWSGDPPNVPKTSAKLNRRAGKVKPGDEKEIDPATPAVKDSKPEPGTPPPPATDSITLVNGDETSGTLETATASELMLKCDAGRIEVPLKRTLMVELAGTPGQPAAGIRLHLSGKGTLTVDSLRIADGKVECHSAVTGDLTFNSEALSEIVFQPRNLPPPERTGENARSNSGRNINGNIIIRGGGALQIQGNVIIKE